MTKKLPPSKSSKFNKRKSKHNDTDSEVEIDSSNKQPVKRRSKRIKDVNQHKTKKGKNSEPICTSNRSRTQTRRSNKKPTRKKQGKNHSLNITDVDNDTNVDNTCDIQGINVIANYDSLPVVGATSAKKSVTKKKIVGNKNRRQLTVGSRTSARKLPMNNGHRSTGNNTTKKKKSPNKQTTLRKELAEEENKETRVKKKHLNKTKNKQKTPPEEKKTQKDLTKEEKIKNAKNIVKKRHNERLWRESVAERINKGEFVPPEERKKYERFLARRGKQRKQQQERNARIKNDAVAHEKQKEKRRVSRSRERSEGYLHKQKIVNVDSPKKRKRKKSDKNNEERKVKKRKPSKKEASAKRKADVSKDNNSFEKRKIDVSSETAKGMCRVLPDVNVMNMSSKPLRRSTRSTRLSTGATTYNESSDEDEDMNDNNDISSIEDEDMEISDNQLCVSVDEECSFETCVLSTVTNHRHSVHENATFGDFIERVKKENVHNNRDQDDVEFKVHTRGCKCNVMSNFFSRLTVNFEVENCEYFIHRKGSKEIKNVMIVSRDKISELKTDGVSALMDEQELYEMILNENDCKDLKISFAKCGLNVHRNGFTCIVTKDKLKIDRLMNLRDEKTESERENGELDFHDDYCDYIVAVPCIKLRNEGERGRLFEDCFKRLSCNYSITSYGDVVVESTRMGHHLKTSINTDYFKNLDKKYYVMLIVQLEKIGHSPMESPARVRVTFDIPGGKRHLGEASIACAKRELEEETNITLDAKLYKSVEKYDDVERTGTYYYIDVSDEML